MEKNRIVKNRNVILVYLFGIITFGIYFIYWAVSTKNDMNSMGAKIPTAWLMIIPIVNLYWYYKYCEGFSKTVRKDNLAVVWFVLYLFVSIVMPAIIQIELNKKASGGTSVAPVKPVAKLKAAPAKAQPVAT